MTIITAVAVPKAISKNKESYAILLPGVRSPESLIVIPISISIGPTQKPVIENQVQNSAQSRKVNPIFLLLIHDKGAIINMGT